MMVEVVFKYFPELTSKQKDQFAALKDLYADWNSKINVISRKDMDNIYVNHVLHSLAIGKVIRFAAGSSVLDVGTGGGFPGIPLSILYPDTSFVLLDSVGKKIKVVTGIITSLELGNAEPVRSRVEEHRRRHEYIISRAVSAFPEFVRSTKGILKKGCSGNGIFYLKGGDLSDELKLFTSRAIVREIKEFFSEPFFETKKIVYLPAGS